MMSRLTHQSALLLAAPCVAVALDVSPEMLEREVPLTDYRPVEITPADDAALLRALDLERPELAAVRAAVAAGDEAGAIAAFAAHLRTRTAPVLLRDGQRVMPVESIAPSERRLPSDSPAERILARDFTISGIRHRFEGAIDWQLNPTILPGYKGAWSTQFHTQLSRMHHWRTLAEAWRETDNPVYLRDWIGQFRDWWERNPAPTVDELPAFLAEYRGRMGGTIRLFPLHLPLDAGMRANNTTMVFEMVRRSPEVDDRLLVEVVRMLVTHARLLTQLQATHNHLAIATGGLAAVATMFPEFRESVAWRQEAWLRVAVDMKRQVYPDGAQMELTPWYHYTAQRNFADVIELAAANGFLLPEGLFNDLERMYDYCARIADPDLRAPPLNDAEYLNVGGLMRRGAALFPHREDFRFLGTRRAEGRAPEFVSLIVPWAGQAVMRSGWEREALYLLMEYGPFGTGHMHEDKLGLVVNAFGRQLLVDSGRGPYEASVWRDYGVNAAAHNTVLVDGLGQARRLHERSTARVDAPAPVAWSSDVRLDYVAAAFGERDDEVFAPPLNPPGKIAPQFSRLVLDESLRGDGSLRTLRAAHRRHVLFVKPHYWVIVDVLTPEEQRSHAYTSLFHCGAGEARAEGLALHFGAPGQAGMVLAAAPGTADALELIAGQEEPFILGWQFADAGSERTPIPTAVFRRTAAGVSAHAYVLVPHRAGVAAVVPAITAGPAGDGVLAVTVNPGRGLPASELRVAVRPGAELRWGAAVLAAPAAASVAGSEPVPLGR